MLALLLATSGLGCAWYRHLLPPPRDSRVHVMSLRHIASGDDLADAADRLESLDGVHRADADLVRAEITVWTRPQIADAPLVSALGAAGFEANAGAGQGGYLPPPAYRTGADVRVLTVTGRDIEDLASHVVPGKVTIFDFYADWCEPCRLLDRRLVSLLASRDDVAVRKVNIVDFDRPVARRWVGDGIPLILICNRAGQPVARLRGYNERDISAALARAGL